MITLSDITLQHHLYLGLALFFIGFFGILLRKNILVILMCIELMLNAVNLLLIAASQYYGSLDGQIMTFFVMTIASAEAGIGLALAVQAYKRVKSIDLHTLNRFRG